MVLFPLLDFSVNWIKRSSNFFDAIVAQEPGSFMLVDPLKTSPLDSVTAYISLNFRLMSLFYELNTQGQNLKTCLTLNCRSFGILLNTKTLSIKHACTTKTVLFFTCKRHYNNDVNYYQDSIFASDAQWRRPLFFQNG